MKESIFNMYFTAQDGCRLVFNSVSCGLAVVDDLYEELIHSLAVLDEASIPERLKECFSAARDGLFIVPDDLDELVDLKTKRNCQKYSTESLGLTIAPTLACNFKCIYCYETNKSGIMSESVMDSIVDFVKSQVTHLKNFGVSWYGGEPLLAKESIYRMSEKFMSLCKEHSIEYHAYMISNGSLLDDITIEKLIQYQVKGIQITIDGPPSVHDARRVSKNGEGTFELLINNINKLLKTEINVTLRINVDKSNDSEVEELLKILGKRLISKKIRITFGQVMVYTEACRSIEGECYDNGEFAERLIHYYKAVSDAGFSEYNELPYPSAKLNYCCAELMNSFVIDPYGYAYKCWNNVGDVSTAVGNLTDSSFDITGCKNGSWLLRNPMDNSKCAKCPILPLCMGGCPHNDISLKKENVCDVIKYNIQDIMLNYYEASKQAEVVDNPN